MPNDATKSDRANEALRLLVPIRDDLEAEILTRINGIAEKHRAAFDAEVAPFKDMLVSLREMKPPSGVVIAKAYAAIVPNLLDPGSSFLGDREAQGRPKP